MTLCGSIFNCAINKVYSMLLGNDKNADHYTLQKQAVKH